MFFRLALNWTKFDTFWCTQCTMTPNQVQWYPSNVQEPLYQPTLHAQLFVLTLRWSKVLFNVDWLWRNELQVCHNSLSCTAIYHLWHVLGWHPLPKSCPLWTNLHHSTSELTASMPLSATGPHAQCVRHARTVWLLPLYLALNMKLWGKIQANYGQICVHTIPSCASALLMLVDNSKAKRMTNYQWKRLWISMGNKQ